MAYTPPAGDGVGLGFADGYIPAPAQSVNLEFDPDYLPDAVRLAGGIAAEKVPEPGVRLKSRWLRVEGGDAAVVPQPILALDIPRVAPIGIDATAVVGTPEYVRWDRFLVPASITAPLMPHPVERVRLPGGYNPPPGGSLILNWFADPYSPPPGASIQLEFGAIGYGYVWPAIGDTSVFGDTSVGFPFGVRLTGIAPPTLSAPHVQTSTNAIRAAGFNAAALGLPVLSNTGSALLPVGIVSQDYGTPTIFNYRQYVPLVGYRSDVYGTAFLGGGVKSVTPSGYLAGAVGRPALVNTTADQTAKPFGIGPPQAGRPDVSPRSLFPFGIHGSAYGTALVQRTPAPYGFDTMVFGQPSIEYWTKYLHAPGIAPVEPGYPRVFDPTQKVFPSSVARSTVFGDTAIFNQSRFIRVPGEDYFEGSDWTQLENNRRPVLVAGFVATVYGNTEIRNRWPTVAPVGFDALRPSSPTETGVGYSIRYIYHSGIYRTAYGRPTVTKTPEIAPKGFAGESGTPTVWFRNRTLEAKGGDAALIPEPNIWFRFRHLAAEGFESHGYGTHKLEHSTRALAALGTSFMLLGNPKIEARNRTLTPEGIWENFASNHMVGTDRWLQPVGFDAARFGARIIPEIQNLYPQGFSNPYGLATIWNATQLIVPPGFVTVGQQPADRWGLSRVFNSDQYVVMYFDPDSHLNPPAWPQWTKIENRNRVMRTAGNDVSRFGTAQIDNNARPLLPSGIAPPTTAEGYKAGMVAYRIRPLQLEGLEAPYLSTWAVVYNDAFVAAPRGMVATEFGQAALENNRRYFPYITAADQSAFGTPMIADRIRTLEIESRYSIAPPLIRLPEVKLYTRYLEPVGDEMFRQGWASLSIHWKIISPRWTHQNFFGWSTVRNLTPELQTRGRNAEEFGDTFVRLEWRPIYPHGAETVLHGRSQIADRDRTIPIQGIRSLALGDKLRVIRTGAPPYSEQYIWLDGTSESGEENRGGNGIPPPGTQQYPQVPRPTMNQQVVYHESQDPMTKVGMARVVANGVRVEPGLQALTTGEPFVSLKIRTVKVDEFPETEVYEPSNASLSPHTIWAVVEAPEQARKNHPGSGGLHYVGDLSPRGFGHANVTLFHRVVSTRGFIAQSIGRPSAHNSLSFIKVEGISSLRSGWHSIPGDIYIEVMPYTSTLMFGAATVSRPPYLGDFTAKPAGVTTQLFSPPTVEFRHRVLKPVGYLAEQVGSKHPRPAEETPYAWKGLRVGELMPTIPEGFSSEMAGEHWVSFKVREVNPEGYDAFLSEYQLEMFDQRMRVRRVEPPRVREFVEPVGLEYSALGVPNVRAGVHFIRPDGNADQFRKGAF